MSDDAFDTIVVGAGPGGIAAAVTAAEAGRRVALIDDNPFPGGQIWRNRGESPKPKSARRWLARLATSAITHLRQSRVIANPAPLTLLIETPAGHRLLRCTSLILATGARELFLPFPGWTLPGVVGAGGMQALVKQGLVVHGKRVIVAGTGPLLLAVAALLRSQGAVVPLILEQAPAGRIHRFALSLLRSPSKLLDAALLRARLLGTRYATDSYPLRVTPGLKVEYRSGDREQSIDCDYLACGFGLIPNTELAQLLGCEMTADGFIRVDDDLRTTVPHIFAVGELTGIGGVDKAIIEGRIAAGAPLHHQRARALAFTCKLAMTFTLRPELFKLAQGDTIVCRCEDVPLSAIQDSLTARDAKLQTRCGMGPCQARICGPILQRLLNCEPAQIRPPILPSTIATLAESQPT